jgi:hypothetical protein
MSQHGRVSGPTPGDRGYRVTCSCGWTREYATKAAARGGIAGHQAKPAVDARRDAERYCPFCRTVVEPDDRGLCPNDADMEYRHGTEVRP